MDAKLHFISGLPRSGSTLLSAILRQNPRFYAGMSSPCAGLFMAMQGATSRRNETSVFLDEQQKIELLRGTFSGVYHAQGKNDVVFDTNRAWCSKLPALTRLYPEAKVICCVRDVGWIMDSIERLTRANPFELSGMFGYEPYNTVFTRIGQVASSNGMVGYALDALREAFFGSEADRLILVDYEALTRNPDTTMRAIYNFVGEPWFEHDFDRVEYDARDFDISMGTPNLHTVRSKVAFKQRKSVLPPDLFNTFAADAFWKRPEIANGPVQIILPGPPRNNLPGLGG